MSIVTQVPILFVLVLAPLAWLWAIRTRRAAQRRAVRRRPFPDAWRAILECSVPLYPGLPETLKGELHELINVFLDEKVFEGAGGLNITDEIRLTIAAQACILLLNRNTAVYPRLFSIIVYPHSFEVAMPRMFSPGLFVEDTETRLGESWRTGAIVLAWDHVLQSTRDLRDGHNLVFHEFAHQIDQEDGEADGVPLLDRPSHYLTWARVLSRDYEDLRLRVAQGRRSFMNQYGAKNEAEFFAVATEFFFEQPSLLQSQYPDLYNELKSFYKQDPQQYRK